MPSGNKSSSMLVPETNAASSSGSESSSTVYSVPSSSSTDAKAGDREKKGIPRVKSVTFPSEEGEGGQGPSSSRRASQGSLPPLAPRADGHYHNYETANVSLDSSGSSRSSPSDDGGEGGDGALEEEAATSETSSATEKEEEGDDYSVRKTQASSRAQRSPASSTMGRHTGLAAARSEMTSFTDDNRSTLVCHLDVEVAVRKRSLVTLANKMYLRVRVAHLKERLREALRQKLLVHPVAGVLGEEVEARLREQTAATWAALDVQIQDSQDRLFGLYRRHMDAVVERYLSAPQYVTARWHSRQHMPLAVQRLHAVDAVAQFERSSTASYSRARMVENARRNHQHVNFASSIHERESIFHNPNEHKGHDGHQHRHDSNRPSKVAVPGVESASTHHGSALGVGPAKDKYRYELTSHDVELLVQDAARRNRFRDDTLPWRPVDFRMTALRLEPLDLGVQGLDEEDAQPSVPEMNHSFSLFTYPTGDRPKAGTGGASDHRLHHISTNAVGGSVNLLIEILLMTEVDPPFTSGVPEPTFTNVFMFLSEMFVTPDSLVTKFIRFFRSVRRWRPDLADAERATYLLCRTVECIHAYCRCHECDLTMQVIQRLSAFIESVGLASVDSNSQYWACKQGVYDPSNLRDLDLARHDKRQTGGDLRGTGAHGRAAHRSQGFLFRKRALSPSAEPGPPPLDMRVQQLLLGLSVYLQIIYHKYYVKVCDVLCDRREVRRHPKSTHKTGQGLSSDGTSTILPPTQPAVQETMGVYINKATPRGRLFTLIVPTEKADGAHPAGDAEAAVDGGGGIAAVSARPARGAAATRADRFVSFGPPLRYWPHRAQLDIIVPFAIDAEPLSHQLCLLSYHLFSAVHIREMLYNTWSLASMRVSVAQHLQKLLHYSAQLRLWATAVIVVPQKLSDCQRALRHLLDVCRTLYELQNYEIAAAVLEGLRHPAVEAVRSQYSDEFMQPMLSAAEARELETLTQMMNPYASYSPSSLNSITARTSSVIETSLIPILAPILQILLNAQLGSSQWTSHEGAQASNEQRVAFVRNTDGQFVVNWSKVMSIGHVVKIWLRCQSVPYKFTPDVVLQEYLWSLREHSWTEDLLSRLANAHDSSVGVVKHHCVHPCVLL
ncbi:hypothetical protein STCU_10372 [Strigomonas culicis]|uniref:Ras-GEF domain-containing protein n=1 Tax=Strigomonas culicis TaxID=28005 RepID=S9TM03_9TRYP|nr:hypothetical protein STCU_10372 [Strigomonas culicis]|eukprot:EPY17829.1 hypothetical protein STCU_10372 [Strigomonas culicis]